MRRKTASVLAVFHSAAVSLLPPCALQPYVPHRRPVFVIDFADALPRSSIGARQVSGASDAAIAAMIVTVNVILPTINGTSSDPGGAIAAKMARYDGDRPQIGPGVQTLTADHPHEPEL
jgi:hypothetical protein